MDARDTFQSPLVRKLESIFALSPDERSAVSALNGTVRQFGPGEDVVVEGDRPSACCLILEGWGCRYKVTGVGKRQILSFHLPGDVPDLQSLHLRVMDHSLAMLVASRVAFIAHSAIRDLIRHHPRIGDAFWRDTLIDAAVFREWMLGLGRRDARQRLCHLFCELFVRLDALGMVDEYAFGLPLTQAELADALGITPVHINRTLQDLRGEGLIELRRGRVELRDWDGLKAIGEFDDAYLHLRKVPA
jgi:CRP-like cAMP-binding protein